MPADVQTATCQNCGEPLTGAFCSACGQRADTKSLSMRVVADTLLNALFDMDSRVWRTIKELTLNPGQVALDYNAGHRVRYINPLKYFITVYAISIALSIYTGELEQTVDYSQLESSQSLDGVEGEGREDAEKFLAFINEILTKRLELLTFLTVPLMSVLMRLHNFRAGKNLAETTVFQCYVWGHYALLGIPLTPTIYLSVDLNFWAKTLLLVWLLYYGMKVFYDRGWLRSIVSVAFASLYMIIATFGAMALLFSLHLLGLI